MELASLLLPALFTVGGYVLRHYNVLGLHAVPAPAPAVGPTVFPLPGLTPAASPAAVPESLPEEILALLPALLAALKNQKAASAQAVLTGAAAVVSK